MKKGAHSGTASGGDFQQAKSSTGQGAGFYVWSDAASAKNHSIETSGEFGSGTKMGGSPMIVVVESVLEPEEWDLDYETNAYTVAKWLRSNWDTVKDDLGKVLDLDKSKVTTRGGTVSGMTGEMTPVTQGLKMVPQKDTGLRPLGITWQQDDKTVAGNVSAGDKLGLIMNALSTGQNKALVHEFEEGFFANMPNGVAVKYAGANTLAVKRIEILKDGQWVDFSTH
jgi:hypothetical protein